LDPFAGSGTTLRVARDLKRNSVGIEIDKSLVPVITEKLGFNNIQTDIINNIDDKLEIVYREEGKYGPIG
jgi:site-specific DNA-methyltransferase (adenine-specific)